MNIVELDKRAMLVSLTIPTIQSVTTVRSTTNTVVSDNNAQRAAVRVVAAKLPTARAAAVQSKLDYVRSLHTALTLPFIGQFRLLRAETYLDYLSRVQIAIDAAQVEVVEQFGCLPDVLADIAKQMGDIPYDVTQVPSSSELLVRASVKPVFLPITSLFPDRMMEKLGVDSSELNKMNNAQTQLVQNIAVDSMQGVLDEVIEAVGRVATSLTKYDEDKPEFNTDGKKTRRSSFHATMITNLIDLADRLPLLDLSTEQRLVTVAGTLKTLARYDADTLKDNTSARIEILHEATELLASLTGVVSEQEFGDDTMFGGLL